MQTQNYTPNELAKSLLEDLGGPDSFVQVAKIVRLIAKIANPVPVAKVAEALNVSSKDAKDLLARYNAELDENGNLLGLGLTMVPTNHVFEVDNYKFYAWCAGDTLIIPMMLGQIAHVESVDPISGAKIRLTTTPEGAQNVEPRTTVLSWPIRPNSGDVRASFCDVTHFFASRETALEYASRTRGVTVLTPEQVREIFGIIAKHSEILAQ